MDDNDNDNNYRLIGGEDSKNTDEPNDKETAYLLNDVSPRNTSNQIRENSSSSPSSVFNGILNSFDSDNYFTKLIIGIMLFHPIVSLMIQNNENVKKTFTKSQRKLIKKVLIVFMFFCLVGFSSSSYQGSNYFLSFFIKFILIFFLLIHTNIFNVTNIEETARFWRKIFNNRKNK